MQDTDILAWLVRVIGHLFYALLHHGHAVRTVKPPLIRLHPGQPPQYPPFTHQQPVTGPAPTTQPTGSSSSGGTAPVTGTGTSGPVQP